MATCKGMLFHKMEALKCFLINSFGGGCKVVWQSVGLVNMRQVEVRKMLNWWEKVTAHVLVECKNGFKESCLSIKFMSQWLVLIFIKVKCSQLTHFILEKEGSSESRYPDF